jgi:hypothetical protein
MYTHKGEKDLMTKVVEVSDSNMEIYDYEFTELHFANMRNALLDTVKTEWILFLDVDDRLVEYQNKNYDTLFQVDKKVEAFRMYYTGIHKLDGVVKHYHYAQIKLFRNRGHIRYFGACHEHVAYNVTKNGGIIADSDMIILHSGYDASDKIKEKVERNIETLLRFSHEYFANKEYWNYYILMLKKELSILKPQVEGVEY